MMDADSSLCGWNASSNQRGKDKDPCRQSAVDTSTGTQHRKSEALVLQGHTTSLWDHVLYMLYIVHSLATFHLAAAKGGRVCK